MQSSSTFDLDLNDAIAWLEQQLHLKMSYREDWKQKNIKTYVVL